MSKSIPVIRVNATGALIRLHDGNRNMLNQPGVSESSASVDEKTGRLTEINGADYTAMISASKDLVRIGTAIQSNQVQRQALLTAALKLPGAEDYLTTLGVYDGKDDRQYIDPDTLIANNAGLEGTEVKVVSQEEMRAMKADAQKTETRSTAKRKKVQKAEPDEDRSVDLTEL